MDGVEGKGGFTKNQYRRGDCLKKRAGGGGRLGQFVNFRGETWQERGGCF